MVGDKECASDILQDVFISLFEKTKGGTVIIYLNTWLYKSTLNNCLDKLNRQKRFKTLEDLPEASITNDSIEKNEKSAILRKALSTLEPKEKALLIMYSEGFTYKEISDSTGIRFTSVGKTLARTLDKMENRLKANRNELY